MTGILFLPLTTTANDLKLGIIDFCEKSEDDILKNSVTGGSVPVILVEPLVALVSNVVHFM